MRERFGLISLFSALEELGIECDVDEDCDGVFNFIWTPNQTYIIRNEKSKVDGKCYNDFDSVEEFAKYIKSKL